MSLSSYIASFYFIITTFVTVGYGDIIPRNFREYHYVMVFNLIATIIFAMMNGKLSSIMALLTQQKQTNHQTVSE